MECEICADPVDPLHAEATGQLCPRCFVNEWSRRRKPIQVLHRGVLRDANLRGKHRVSPERARRKNARKQWRRQHDPDLSERHRKVEAARARALRRLRSLHPDDYVRLYAEERAAAGLEPLTAQAVAKLAAPAAYHASVDPGEAHDAEAVEP